MNRTLLTVLCVLAGVLLLLVAVMSTVTLVQQSDIQENTDRIAATQHKLRVAQHKLAVAQKKLAGVDALCKIAIAQRAALEQQVANSRQYLASPAAAEAPGLASFVRTLSLPQLRARLKTEHPPKVCKRIVQPG